MASVRVANTEDLPAIQRLHRADSKWLGAFPQGAFEDALDRKHLLVAVESEVCGYLAYRESSRYRRLAIVHLCIAKTARGRGLAKLLVNELCHLHPESEGVRVSCRRDFAVSDMWPKLDFHVVGEKDGRAKAGSKITVWWRPIQGTKSLFHSDYIAMLEQRRLAVLDANLVYDKATGRHPESRHLDQAWLREEVSFCVTPEIGNEIYRNSDDVSRRQSLSSLSGYVQLEGLPDDVAKASETIRIILGTPQSDQDQSDQKHLAHAVAAGAHFFLTRDGNVLEHAEAIELETTLKVVRPSEFISNLDRLLNETAYQPRRMRGSELRERRLCATEAVETWNTFAASGRGEVKRQYLTRLRNLCADHSCEVSTIEDSQSHPLALFACRTSDYILDVPLLRVKGRPTLALTLIRHLLDRLLTTAIESRCFACRITDPCLSQDIAEELPALAFSQYDDAWQRLTPHWIGSREQIEHRMRRTAERDEVAANALRASSIPKSSSDFENDLWPSKIVDRDIPCYLIPIRAEWAAFMIDPDLAAQRLISVDFQLALRRENVYFRSARGRVDAPARILWYVSLNRRYAGTMAVRATSAVDEVVVGPAKELFRQNQRLAVYNWSDVLEVAKGSPDADVMAIRFSRTQRFTQPILLRTLEDRGLHAPQAPRRISNDLFFDLYCQGTKQARLRPASVDQAAVRIDDLARAEAG